MLVDTVSPVLSSMCRLFFRRPPLPAQRAIRPEGMIGPVVPWAIEALDRHPTLIIAMHGLIVN
jgi:hypothetical protein